MDLKARLLIELMAVVASLVLYPQSVAGGKELKDLQQLLDAAKQIESASTLLDRKPIQLTDQKRRELHYLFARESKSTFCEEYYVKMSKLAADYKVKAHEFVDDMTTGNNGWFKNVVTLGGAMGAMKNMAKSDQVLNSITARYESQAKHNKRAVSHEDIDCDMLKFQIRSLKDIVFVLQTDVRHLILGETEILNEAIYDKLKADKFISTTNFHDTRELTLKQKQLVLDYFASRVDPDATTVGEAVDHFLSLKPLIIGRLIDSCHSIGEYGKIWYSIESDRLKSCPKSKSDPNNQLFEKEIKLETFKDTMSFCQNFLEAL